MKQKIWSIAWRVIYILVVGFLVTGLLDTNGNEGLWWLVYLCIGCLFINIPWYIYCKITESESDRLYNVISWEHHPIRNIILGLLAAPIITILMVVNLVLDIIKILLDR